VCFQGLFQGLSLKAKARTKNLPTVLKESLRTGPRPRTNITGYRLRSTTARKLRCHKETARCGIIYLAFLTAELFGKIDAFLRRARRYGLAANILTVSELFDSVAEDFFQQNPIARPLSSFCVT